MDMTFVIRPEMPADHALVQQVHTEAFGGDEEARLVEALRYTPEYIPELSLVAEVDGELAGHVMVTRVSIGEQHHPALALAPLGVLPIRQRRGIGTALVEHALEACRRLGHTLVIVVGEPAYYQRFGFRPGKPSGVTAPFPVPDAAFMALALTPDGMDGVTGEVQYADPFYAL